MKITLTKYEIELAMRQYMADYVTSNTRFANACTLNWYSNDDGPWCLEAEMPEPKEPQA